MKKCLTFFCCLFLFQAGSLPAQDIFGGLLEKEKPVFTASFLPGPDKGTARLALFFTHSKMDALEVSIWVQDKGPLLDGAGERKLASDLRQIRNRQTDTITLAGLSNMHFYVVSIDFRNPQAISRKFSTEVVENAFRYELAPRQDMAVKSPVKPKETIGQGNAHPNPAAANPCKNPNIILGVERSGYCESGNRPALLVQCTNCENRNWKFSVELRNTYEDWRPIRSEGNQQLATGNALRREPLCLLRPGEYYARVLAWGDNCPQPVVVTHEGAIDVSDQPPLPAANPEAIVEMQESEPLPDSCQVSGQAALNGSYIQGWLYLPAYSTCAYLKPRATVRYVNPKHRDMTLEQIPLIPGAQNPFQFALDARDLDRGIHTIQVVVLVSAPGNGDDMAVESFWLKAGDTRSMSASAYDQPGITANTQPAKNPPSDPAWNPAPTGANQKSAAGQTTTPPNNGFEEEPFIDPMLEQQIQEVSVTASDPNCTPIQDLRLVFDPKNPGNPLYISWLSPRCCQEGGCEYTVWSGASPSSLKLLVKGNKPGAVISELLANNTSGDRYYEVVVKSPNGNRKAAYVLGEGPKYGIEQILDYQDRIKGGGPKSDTLVAVREKPAKVLLPTGETQVATPQVNWNETAAVKGPGNLTFVYDSPKYDATGFEPCKYKRETTVSPAFPGIQPGTEISLKYDFNDKDYRFTLYLLPEDVDEWVIAPGTRELQEKPEFKFEATPHHSGKYVVLSIKNGGTWGCLSTPLEEAIRITVN